EGDGITGINTLPVLFGRERVKALVCFLIVLFLTLVILFDVKGLFILLPFSLLSVIFMFKDNYHVAHSFGSLGFILLPLWVLIT
ncbi:MAG: hypothetical protein JSV39_00835, partial [Candidatus Aenigmatarchaeota archaeon]